MLAPCKDCEDRQIGCRATCEKYLEYKAKAEEIAKRQRADAHHWMDYKGYKKAKYKRLGGKNE